MFREEAGRLAASVTRILGDFDVAEEVVQDALLAAWQQWPVDGLPDRPGAWLWTVARRRAIDVLRRDLRYDAEWLAALLARLMPAEPEVLGLLALVRLHRARAATRFDAEGRLVLLRHQDRARWNKAETAATKRGKPTSARLG